MRYNNLKQKEVNKVKTTSGKGRVLNQTLFTGSDQTYLSGRIV